MRDDYYCMDCHRIFEYLKPYGEEFPESTACMFCGSMNTKRKIGNKNFMVPDHMKAVNSK